MWAFADQMMRGAGRNRAGAGSRTWPMLVGAGVGIAAWEIARRQNYSWMSRMVTQRSIGRRKHAAASNE